jgi:hypothetical protein
MRMKCTRVTRLGEPCKAQALPATSPPRCVAHSSRNGRRSSRDEQKTRALLLNLRAAGRVGESLRAVGVSRRTFYAWLERDEGFRERVQEARRDGLLRVRSLIEAQRPWMDVAMQLEAEDAAP